MCNKTLSRFYRLTPLLLIAMLSMQSASAAKQGMRVYDQGMKEDMRLYQVICKDGTRVSVTSHFDIPEPSRLKIADPENPPRISKRQPGGEPAAYGVSPAFKPVPKEVCAHSSFGKPHCRSSWDVDKAATFACRKSSGRK